MSQSTTTAWRPDPGDALTITIEDISEHDAGYGKYPIVEGADDATQSTVVVHAFHDVLKSELAKLAPTIGDTIVLRYDGKHPEKGYHRYRVRRPDGSGPGIDWAKYGGDPPKQDPPTSDVPNDFGTYGQPPAKPKDGDDDVLPF